ncbi:hypothetical protein [Neptunomonas marina]|uniref:Uncharacterized protein n=1 Tax=Neptunomonas marina TaxID=1815562 RepID=A0A437QE69_9GAMM|nr:hypothetical protein [Neptunomonas marina]RVU32683.1 hypothetical protein EOE65_03245 [Neptunomonas marina]
MDSMTVYIVTNWLSPHEQRVTTIKPDDLDLKSGTVILQELEVAKVQGDQLDAAMKRGLAQREVVQKLNHPTSPADWVYM